MADYYTHFSCLLDLGSAGKAAKALEIYRRMDSGEEDGDDTLAGLYGGCLGFEVQLQDGSDGSVLWISDADGGDVESVIQFVLRCAEDLDLTGLWGFDFAHTCSRPRLDAFGGGAHVIDLGARKSIGWISTQEWLSAALNGEDIDAVEALVG
jgi:hypothetical protein